MTEVAHPQVRSFELWMVSNAAAGAAIGAFLTLLVPPFITAETGSPARSGIVFAVISLVAVVGPWFGGRADRNGQAPRLLPGRHGRDGWAARWHDATDL